MPLFYFFSLQTGQDNQNPHCALQTLPLEQLRGLQPVLDDPHGANCLLTFAVQVNDREIIHRLRVCETVTVLISNSPRLQQALVDGYASLDDAGGLNIHEPLLPDDAITVSRPSWRNGLAQVKKLLRRTVPPTPR